MTVWQEHFREKMLHRHTLTRPFHPKGRVCVWIMFLVRAHMWSIVRLWYWQTPGPWSGHRKRGQNVEVLSVYMCVCIREMICSWVYPHCWVLCHLIPTMVRDRGQKYQIIPKKNLNYVPCKMDSKSIQSISSNNATRWVTPAAITHTWPLKLHPQKGCCFTDCLQILSSRKDISETRACQGSVFVY